MTRRRWLFVMLSTLMLAAFLPLTSSTQAGATEPNPRGSMCNGEDLWFGLAPYNSPDRVRDGWLRTGVFPDYRVAEGTDVDWKADPYGDLSWRMWLDGLGWTYSLLQRYDEEGDPSDLAFVAGIVRDYVTDQPMNASTKDRDELQQSSHRLQLMVCLRERMDPVPTWLDNAIGGTVAFLEKNWAGLWNHGQNQDMAILTAGCALGRKAWTDLATDRLGRILAVSIDSQGATNEQSSQYAVYSYERWAHTAELYTHCGLPQIPALAKKLPLARELIIHATQPDGKLVMIGDTLPQQAGFTSPTSRALSRAWTKGGYAFGRSAWNTKANYFTLRFGPSRLLHGQPDRGSVSYFANGSRVITEPGSIGYTHRDTTWFRRAPEAHNSLIVDKGTCGYSHATAAAVARPRMALDRYVLNWTACNGRKVTREVRYTRSNGLLDVRDSTNTFAKSAQFRQLWHLVPGAGVTAKRTSKHVVVVTLTMPNRSKATLTVRSKKGIPFRFAVVKGSRNPMQGWVSGGHNKPVAARVLVFEQRGRVADLQTTLVPR